MEPAWRETGRNGDLKAQCQPSFPFLQPLRPREGDWLIPAHPGLEARPPVLCCRPPASNPSLQPVAPPDQGLCSPSFPGSNGKDPCSHQLFPSGPLPDTDLSPGSIWIHSVARVSFLPYEGGPQATQRGYENPLSRLKSQAGPATDLMPLPHPQIPG